MLSFEQTTDTTAPSVYEGDTPDDLTAGDLTADGLTPDAHTPDSQTPDSQAPDSQAPDSLPHQAQSSAARVLELAATTADQLLADAKTEAEELVAAARADADGVRQELTDDKAALEAQIAALHQLQDDHRTHLRQHLTEQLSRLDEVMPEAPAAVRG